MLAGRIASIVYAAKADRPVRGVDARERGLGRGRRLPSRPTIRARRRSTMPPGRVIRVTDALGKTEYYGYDEVGNKTSFTSKKGSAAGDVAYTWNYEYDANGRMTYERTPAVDSTFVTESSPTAALSVSTSNARLVTKFEYDALGNLRFKREAYGTTQERSTEYPVRRTRAADPHQSSQCRGQRLRQRRRRYGARQRRDRGAHRSHDTHAVHRGRLQHARRCLSQPRRRGQLQLQGLRQPGARHL